MVKVIVTGGRDFQSSAQVWSGMDMVHATLGITELMQGGAKGVDQFAREWATRHPEVKRYVCHAEWEKHGPSAGPIRNARMLEWEPDYVVAFEGGRGTANMVKLAEDACVPVIHIRGGKIEKWS